MLTDAPNSTLKFVPTTMAGRISPNRLSISCHRTITWCPRIGVYPTAVAYRWRGRSGHHGCSIIVFVSVSVCFCVRSVHGLHKLVKPVYFRKDIYTEDCNKNFRYWSIFTSTYVGTRSNFDVIDIPGLKSL